MSQGTKTISPSLNITTAPMILKNQEEEEFKKQNNILVKIAALGLCS